MSKAEKKLQSRWQRQAIKKAQVDAEIAGMMRDFDRQYSNGVASNIAYNFMCNIII